MPSFKDPIKYQGEPAQFNEGAISLSGTESIQISPQSSSVKITPLNGTTFNFNNTKCSSIVFVYNESGSIEYVLGDESPNAKTNAKNTIYKILASDASIDGYPPLYDSIDQFPIKAELRADKKNELSILSFEDDWYKRERSNLPPLVKKEISKTFFQSTDFDGLKTLGKVNQQNQGYQARYLYYTLLFVALIVLVAILASASNGNGGFDFSKLQSAQSAISSSTTQFNLADFLISFITTVGSISVLRGFFSNKIEKGMNDEFTKILQGTGKTKSLELSTVINNIYQKPYYTEKSGKLGNVGRMVRSLFGVLPIIYHMSKIISVASIEQGNFKKFLFRTALLPVFFILGIVGAVYKLFGKEMPKFGFINAKNISEKILHQSGDKSRFDVISQAICDVQHTESVTKKVAQLIGTSHDKLTKAAEKGADAVSTLLSEHLLKKTSDDTKKEIDKLTNIVTGGALDSSQLESLLTLEPDLDASSILNESKENVRMLATGATLKSGLSR